MRIRRDQFLLRRYRSEKGNDAERFYYGDSPRQAAPAPGMFVDRFTDQVYRLAEPSPSASRISCQSLQAGNAPRSQMWQHNETTAHLQNHWLEAPAHPTLTGSDVHVWRVRLRQVRPLFRTLLNILSPPEQLRAGKYHFQSDCEQFVLARGMLRVILSRYLNIEPGQILFSHNQYGKPAVSPDDTTSLRFNASRSNWYALLAVAHGREVGVDIEWVRHDLASLEVADHFFSPAEVTALRALPTHERINAFFDCWTRKESYIKALGRGLSQPLHTFTVSLTPGEPAALLSVDEELGEASRWSLIELFPGAGYRASLAVEGAPPKISCWQAPGGEHPDASVGNSGVVRHNGE